jgi:hypothetical protein
MDHSDTSGKSLRTRKIAFSLVILLYTIAFLGYGYMQVNPNGLVVKPTLLGPMVISGDIIWTFFEEGMIANEDTQLKLIMSYSTVEYETRERMYNSLQGRDNFPLVIHRESIPRFIRLNPINASRIVFYFYGIGLLLWVRRWFLRPQT